MINDLEFISTREQAITYYEKYLSKYFDEFNGYYEKKRVIESVSKVGLLHLYSKITGERRSLDTPKKELLCDLQKYLIRNGN
jgi:hypothetical protein